VTSTLLGDLNDLDVFGLFQHVPIVWVRALEILLGFFAGFCFNYRGSIAIDGVIDSEKFFLHSVNVASHGKISGFLMLTLQAWQLT
jgi:hypothetical protein